MPEIAALGEWINSRAGRCLNLFFLLRCFALLGGFLTSNFAFCGNAIKILFQ